MDPKKKNDTIPEQSNIIEDSTPSEDTDLSPEARAGEYFEIKDTLKTLKEDLKDLKEQHIDFEELKEVSQKAKELKDNIKHDESVNIIQDKISTLKERMDMLKEIIKAELIENNQTEIKANGKVLKVVSVLKETKDENA